MLLLVQGLYRAYQAAEYEVYRCRGNGHVAPCHEVPEIRGNFAPLYLENGKLYKKDQWDANINGPSAIKCNAQIHHGPKGQCCSTRAACVPQKP